MSITGRVVLAVTFQEVDAAPHAQAAAQGDHQSLQHVDSISEKIHKSYFLSSAIELLLKVCCGQFVHLERLIRLYDGRLAFHVPFHIKRYFLSASAVYL